ncbi:MAG: hypothetical protein AAF125_12120 [Chloroflexota bacterium]
MTDSHPSDAYETALDIETPVLYRCNVFRYHSGLSRLYVRVFKGLAQAPSFYLFFSDVGYFEGPMNWKGADLRRAPSADCLSLMQTVGLVEDFMLDDPETRLALAEAAHLYVFRTSQTEVRLIAGEVVRLQDVPEDLI